MLLRSKSEALSQIHPICSFWGRKSTKHCWRMRNGQSYLPKSKNRLILQMESCSSTQKGSVIYLTKSSKFKMSQNKSTKKSTHIEFLSGSCWRTFGSCMVMAPWACAPPVMIRSRARRPKLHHSLRLCWVATTNLSFYCRVMMPIYSNHTFKHTVCKT